MKNIRFFLIMLLSLAISSAFSQSVPNGNFEGWTEFGTYENPDHWQTPNNQTAALFTFTVTKETTDVMFGSYAARLETKSLMGGAYTVPGFITLGDYTVDMATQEVSLFGGIPFSHKPDSFFGYIKYAPKLSDTCLIAVELFSWDNQNNQKKIIAEAVYTSSDSMTNYQRFSVPLNYYHNETPDSLNIFVLSSSEFAPQVGSVLLVDSLGFWSAPNSVENMNAMAEWELYPNPAMQEVTITGLDANKLSNIRIYDLQGQLIQERSIQAREINLDVGDLVLSAIWKLSAST